MATLYKILMLCVGFALSCNLWAQSQLTDCKKQAELDSIIPETERHFAWNDDAYSIKKWQKIVGVIFGVIAILLLAVCYLLMFHPRLFMGADPEDTYKTNGLYGNVTDLFFVDENTGIALSSFLYPENQDSVKVFRTTDDGWNMLYQILPDGTSNLSVLEYEMGIDGNGYISDFMALYLNERAVGASATDLKRLYEHFCTKELAEELSAATFPIVSDDSDFRHADRTLQTNNLDDLNGLPFEKYSFEVKFKPNPNNDNVTDILYMEVDGATNKISKIEAGKRKVI